MGAFILNATQFIRGLDKLNLALKKYCHPFIRADIPLGTLVKLNPRLLK